jgi:ankyrin repeat protein
MQSQNPDNPSLDYASLIRYGGDGLEYDEVNITGAVGEQEAAILAAFLVDSLPEMGKRILAKLSLGQAMQVGKISRDSHLEIEFLDDANLEYGVIPPKIIKGDLFNTYLQFGKIGALKYLVSIDKSLDIHSFKEHSFRVACEHGHLDIAQWLFSLDDINLHALDDYAFRWACKMGHLELAQWLHQTALAVDSPIDIHAESEYAFRWACKLGHLSVIQWLTTVGSIDIHSEGEYSFKWSCWLGNDQTARWLYQHSLNINSPVNIHIANDFAFRWASRNGHLQILQWIYSLGGTDIHAENEYAFRWLCRNGHMEAVEWLLSLGGVNIHAENEYALRYACEGGYLDIVKVLQHQSEQAASPLNFAVEDQYPIRAACANGHIELAKFLITEIRTDFQAENNEAFRFACENGHLELVKWLYSYGPSVGAPMLNRIYAYDDYAFRKACRNGHLDVAKWLYDKAQGGIREDYAYAARILCGIDLDSQAIDQ